MGNPVQYEPGVRTWVVNLSVAHKLLLGPICCLFSALYGYELNGETVARVLEEGYELAAPLEAKTKEQLQQAEVTHFDEAGLRVEGNCRGCTRRVTLCAPICWCMRKRVCDPA